MTLKTNWSSGQTLASADLDNNFSQLTQATNSLANQPGGYPLIDSTGHIQASVVPSSSITAVSIQSITQPNPNTMLITLTNGTTSSLTLPAGPQGQQGPPGALPTTQTMDQLAQASTIGDGDFFIGYQLQTTSSQGTTTSTVTPVRYQASLIKNYIGVVTQGSTTSTIPALPALSTGNQYLARWTALALPATSGSLTSWTDTINSPGLVLTGGPTTGTVTSVAPTIGTVSSKLAVTFNGTTQAMGLPSSIINALTGPDGTTFGNNAFIIFIGQFSGTPGAPPSNDTVIRLDTLAHTEGMLFGVSNLGWGAVMGDTSSHQDVIQQGAAPSPGANTDALICFNKVIRNTSGAPDAWGQLWVNGAQVGNATFGSNTHTGPLQPGFNNLTVGLVGVSWNGTAYYEYGSISIREIIFGSGTLTASDITALHTFSQNTWGTA